MRSFLSVIIGCLLLAACSYKTKVDLLVVNGTVYTVDSAFNIVEAIAVKDGKIIATGSSKMILDNYEANDTIDAKNKFVYPGFIDAHCHFLEYGKGLNECDLVGTLSWQDVIDRLKAFADKHPDGWLIGRGWDQNDWEDKHFPTNKAIDILFPNRPVILSRVDGHAAIANQRALEIAGIRAGQSLPGGDIVVENGILTGLLVDNATDLVTGHLPEPTTKEKIRWLQDAESKCFAVGLTSVHDCGLDASDIAVIKSMYDSNRLRMRMYVMLSDRKENYDWAFSNGKINTDMLTVCAFKLYADGALGSRGACLLQPYSDLHGHYGFMLKNHSYYDSILPIIASKGWQACTHAIGDSANRAILKMYKNILSSHPDLRWRIEHAQVIDKSDFNLFAESKTIPSVQPTQSTSDMYLAAKRLVKERIKSAYAYQQLLQQNGWIPLGTDFPVEDISPIKTFNAAVVRKDTDNYPDTGFQKENALTREQALRGMTIWAAKAAFEENKKGSLEKGKLADFIILDKDLMKEQDNNILSTQILFTIAGGKQVYKSNKNVVSQKTN
jgi:predicted amidohydrolase YtcJ